MKVIVLTSYGSNGLPKEFHADMSDRFWRMDKDLINRIEKADWVQVSDLNEVCDTYKNYSYKLENGIKYIYGTPSNSVLFNIFEIIEVDISRPWCIEEYDGAERILYLDDYKCIDEKSNYFEYKG